MHAHTEMIETVRIHGYERVRHRMGLDVRTVLAAAATFTGAPFDELPCVAWRGVVWCVRVRRPGEVTLME